MIRVHVICEGQTEEEFVRDLLCPALWEKNQVELRPSCIGRVGHKGGNVTLPRLLTDLRNRLLQDSDCFCTTFLDYYGLPPEFPGKTSGMVGSDIADRQAQVISALSAWSQKELGEGAAARFIPYVQMYEFEALLFSDTETFANSIGRPQLRSEFTRIRESVDSPECINDSQQTAPSKRILSLFPGYDKPKDPLLVAQAIGLGTIRRECALFDKWVTKLENVVNRRSDA